MIFRRHWFAPHPDGRARCVRPAAGPGSDQVLAARSVPLKPFRHTNDNIQGYTDGKTVAINPVAKYPLKPLWHELGHVLLGHAAMDTVRLERSVRNVEAERVAYLLRCVFDYDQPQDESRGYVQHWNDTESISADSAKRICRAVAQILDANKLE